MSVTSHIWQKSPLLSQQFRLSLGLAGSISVRWRGRREQDKLKKPEDRSQVVLGKVKPIRPYAQEGVSDKQHPILMKWNKPVRMETCNPQISGDLGGLEDFGTVDLTLPPIEWDGAKELEEAPPEVRQILSLEYRRARDRINRLRHDLVRSVQRHPQDFTSLEVGIALNTVSIRNMQRDLIERFPYKNQPLKHNLTYLIAARRKKFERLREQDYKRYEWILEKLNLFYKPVPVYDMHEVGRRACIERLTDTWCSELKRHRLTAYRRRLEEEQPKFLRDKAVKLKFIMEEERDLGLEQTVTEEEIAACLAKAEQLEARQSDQEEPYLCFQEDVAKDANIYIGS